MPQRQNVMTVPTPDLQGEGSWVKVKAMTVENWERWQEILVEAQRARNNDDVSAARKAELEARELLAGQIMGWNWVNDEGQPLPCLSEDINVFKQLTMDESQFLSSIVVNVEKKAPTK
jgi:hypothetical protein